MHDYIFENRQVVAAVKIFNDFFSVENVVLFAVCTYRIIFKIGAQASACKDAFAYCLGFVLFFDANEHQTVEQCCEAQKSTNIQALLVFNKQPLDLVLNHLSNASFSINEIEEQRVEALVKYRLYVRERSVIHSIEANLIIQISFLVDNVINSVKFCLIVGKVTAQSKSDALVTSRDIIVSAIKLQQMVVTFEKLCSFIINRGNFESFFDAFAIGFGAKYKILVSQGVIIFLDNDRNEFDEFFLG